MWVVSVSASPSPIWPWTCSRLRAESSFVLSPSTLPLMLRPHVLLGLVDLDLTRTFAPPFFWQLLLHSPRFRFCMVSRSPIRLRRPWARARLLSFLRAPWADPSSSRDAASSVVAE